MALLTRTAMLNVRITPAVKYASEQVFHRIGMSMTEAVELFLRRAILEEKLPFEVAALNEDRLMQIAEDYERQLTLMENGEKGKRGRVAQKRIQKVFLAIACHHEFSQKTHLKRRGVEHYNITRRNTPNSMTFSVAVQR
jgi:addiction module RelB/DinJ family antitoxin